MNTSLILALFWLVGANVIGMFPSRKKHWPAAYMLIAVGVPLLGYVIYENGPVIGLVVLLGAASILRWPLVYLWRRIRRLAGSAPE